MDQERIIYILDYLSRYTDEKKAVTIKEIQDHLANVCNLTRVNDVTIRRDLDRLTNAGNHIVKYNREHNTAYYALIDKGFSFNEIRFIVDSISINKFLTSKQKRQLIKKFEGMCSDVEIRQLISRITLNEKCSPSLDLLENLDLIHRLIADRRKINFEYGKYDTDKRIKYYKKKRDLLPVRVVYFNERIYLKCYNEADERWRIYRVDRMRSALYDLGRRYGCADDIHSPCFQGCGCVPVSAWYGAERKGAYLLRDRLSSESNCAGCDRLGAAVSRSALRKNRAVGGGACDSYNSSAWSDRDRQKLSETVD